MEKRASSSSPGRAARGWKRLRTVPADTEVPATVYVSKNDKTGVSVNVSMLGSCRPTKECARYCYGLTGPASFPAAATRHLGNLRHFAFLETAPDAAVQRDVDILAAHAICAQQDFIRWNGVGDMTPGAVRLINALAAERPRLHVWVTTRKPELGAEI